ncbi:MAG TPA: YciI family protein [Xanthomonadaceae bacterium]|nr:YciI family protein [Xanthomonadaceae bacterium]
MLYMIFGRDGADVLDKRLYSRAAHRARLEALLEQGRLVVAGPLPALDCDDPGPAGYAGSLIVAEFGSLEEARQWAGDDPFLKSGVYLSVEVHPFCQVLP